MRLHMAPRTGKISSWIKTGFIERVESMTEAEIIV